MSTEIGERGGEHYYNVIGELELNNYGKLSKGETRKLGFRYSIMIQTIIQQVQ